MLLDSYIHVEIVEKQKRKKSDPDQRFPADIGCEICQIKLETEVLLAFQLP